MTKWIAGWVVGLVGLVPASAEASKFDLGALCDSDVDCAPYPSNPWCNVETGICWTCSDNEQCADEDEVCEGGACVRPCAEDLDCSADEPTCDVGEGHCVMCIDDDGCIAGEHCANGTCRPDECTPGELDCRIAGQLAECQANGGGWDVLQNCWEEGLECLEEDGTPTCVGEGETSGGATDGGAEGTTAGDEAGGASPVTAGDDAPGGDGTGGTNETPAAGGCRSGGTTPVPGPIAGVLAFLLPVWLRRRRLAQCV